MRSIWGKPLSIIMSIMLVVGLCPGLAFAGDMSATDALAPGSVSLSAQEDDQDAVPDDSDVASEKGKDLADAQVDWGSGVVAYVEDGLPNVANTVHLVEYEGSTLVRGADYELRITDDDGNEVMSVPLSDGEYYVHVVGIGDFEGTEADYAHPLRVIEEPVVIEEGVQATGLVFAEKADAEAGTEVVMTVEKMDKDDASTVTAAEVVQGCEEVAADYVGVFDVRLDVVETDTGEEVESLTGNFGDLELAFPVDEKLNGTAARVVQIHADEKTGIVNALCHPVTYVTDGQVKVTVDRLSEFVVMVGADAEKLEFEHSGEVAKPTATDYEYDGAEHEGVPASEGYVLSGEVKATEIGEYEVKAALAEGYQWSDGTEDEILLEWRIFEKSTEPDPEDDEKIDISKAEISLPDIAYVYDGTAKEAIPLVVLDGKTLKLGDDYTLEYEDNVNAGTAKVVVKGIGAYSGVAIGEFAIVEQPEPEPTVATRTMYRMYNPNSGEHFYTSNASERATLERANWHYEGEAWKAPVTSDTPVYRLYSGTDHHYTTDAAERDWLKEQGWKYEGIGWYSAGKDGVPLYRAFNPNVNPKASTNNSGSHHYTTSASECGFLVRLGWKAEGIGWYGMK